MVENLNQIGLDTYFNVKKGNRRWAEGWLIEAQKGGKATHRPIHTLQKRRKTGEIKNR